MTNLSRLTLAVGGTGIAAVLALFIVMQNDDRNLLKQDFGSVSEAARDDAGIGGLLNTFSGSPDMAQENAPVPAIALSPAPVPSTAPADAGRTFAFPTNSHAKAANGGLASVQAERAVRRIPMPVDPLSPGYREKGRDRFEGAESNPLKSVQTDPVSTFSVDVDTASYSFLRRSLNGGALPPKDAIRVEELINYFPYDHAAPESAEEPFRASVTVTPTPWNSGT